MGLLSTLLVVSSSVSCLSASPNNVQMRSYEQLPPLVQDALTNMSGADLDNFIEGITFNPARWMISAEGATGSNHTANKGRIVIKSICVYSL